MISTLKSFAKDLILNSDGRLVRSWLPSWDYYVFTGELCILCECLEATAQLPGPILEIGCAMGHTTIFLNKHMDLIRLDKRYLCVDTFDGFTAEDVDFEVKKRGKDRTILSTKFRGTPKAKFDRTMQVNDIKRVQTIQADVKTHDFAGIRDISFAFIDVDLYSPVKLALEKIVPLMAPGGIVAVHDCAPGNVYDGALEAYDQFITQRGLPRDIRYRLGFVRC